MERHRPALHQGWRAQTGRRHLEWAVGHCGVTEGKPVRGSECRHATQGSFVLGEATRAACVSECKACRSCRYVSYSAEHKDCSFYSRCDLEHLYTSLYGGGTYTITPWDNVRQAMSLGRSLAGVELERFALTRGLSPSANDALRRAGWDVIDASEVPRSAFTLRRIDAPDGTRHWPRAGRVQQRRDNECTSLKLLAWNLTAYDRLMVADSDCCMHEDPLPWMRRHWAEYFVMDREGNFGNQQRGYVGLNSHLFFLQPSAVLFRLLADMATSASFVPFTNSDQDVLETAFAPHTPRPRLPANLHAKARRCAPLSFQPPYDCTPARGTYSTWAERMGRAAAAPSAEGGRPAAPSIAALPASAEPLAWTELESKPASWARGFCDVTAELALGATEGGDCNRGSKGSVVLPKRAASSWHAAYAFCRAHCLRCPRCAVISVSLKWGDCSWFSTCALGALRNEPPDFRTTRVRAAPTAAAHRERIPPARRVAVCMAGHPRTLARPHVYGSIQQNLLGALRKHGAVVDLFALLKTGDSPQKRQKGWDFARVQPNERDTWAALAALQPRLVVRLRRNQLPPHQDCLGMQSTTLQEGQSSTAQPALYTACYDAVASAEALDGILYDWVVRTRPDAYWFAPHPPLCASADDARCSLMAHKNPCGGGPYGYVDQHFALPRALAHVLRAMADQYMRCTATNRTPARWTFNSMEHWLVANLDQAVQAFDLPPPRRPNFPFVLVRNSSREPSATFFCSQPDEHTRACRLSTACMRGAYPDI